MVNLDYSDFFLKFICTFYLSLHPFHPAVHFLSVHVFLQFLLMLFPLHQSPPLYSSLLPFLLNSSLLTSSFLLTSFYLLHFSSSLSLHPFLYPLHHLIDLHLSLPPAIFIFIYFIYILLLLLLFCIFVLALCIISLLLLL